MSKYELKQSYTSNQDGALSSLDAEEVKTFDLYEGETKKYGLTITKRQDGFVNMSEENCLTGKSMDFKLEKDGQELAFFSQDLRDSSAAKQPAGRETGLNSLDGVMAAYKELSNSRKQEAKVMLAFFDQYIFNTPESREVLNEYMHAPTQSELDREKKREDKYLNKMGNKVGYEEVTAYNDKKWKNRFGR